MAYPPLHAYPAHIPALWEQAADGQPVSVPCASRREAEALRFALTGWRSRARDLAHTPNPHLTEDAALASLALAGRLVGYSTRVERAAADQWTCSISGTAAAYTTLRPSWLREQEARLQELFNSTRTPT